MKSIKTALLFLYLSSSHAAISQLPSEQLSVFKPVSFEEYLREFDIPILENQFEYHKRKTIFEKNLKEIQLHNEEDSSWKLGLSPFTHLSKDEFKTMLTLHSKPAITKSFRSGAPKPDISNLPTNVDWRDKGVITPVKNQGMCGSCWAFGATQTVETYWALKTGKLEILAPQQMVECTPNPRRCGGAGGCAGATEELGLQTILDMKGMAKESDYPYTSGTGNWSLNNCKKNEDGSLSVPVAAHIDSIEHLEQNSYEHVLHHIATVGPLSIALDATPLGFYRGGVFDGCPKKGRNIDVNHAVQLVGYGENSTDGKYWIVKNSWGNRWGEKGFFRLRRLEPTSEDFCGWNKTPQNGSACAGDDLKPVKVCGACGMLSETQYAVINDF